MGDISDAFAGQLLSVTVIDEDSSVVMYLPIFFFKKVAVLP